MNRSQKPKGPWFQRFLIRFLTVVLAILVYWILGFLVQDIASIEGPTYKAIEKSYVDQSLVDKHEELKTDLKTIERQITSKRAEMQIVNDSSRNLQRTINQLIELQKLAVKESVPLPDQEQATLSQSLNHFLDSQKAYQARNGELSRLAARKRELASNIVAVEKRIEQQRKPARAEYQKQKQTHNLRLAVYQLLVLLPLLAIGAFLIFKKRDSLYFPLFLGYGLATLIKVSMVIHTYFPSRYFKYVLILGLLVIVVKLLVHFIKMVAFPKVQWLTKQYREAYERFLCPVCEYPIRTGPRAFLFWTRRTVAKVKIPHAAYEQEAYACPSCGTVLFEECSSCHQVRHALLPYCQHCDAEKTLDGTGDSA